MPEFLALVEQDTVVQAKLFIASLQGVVFIKDRCEKWHKKWREVLSDHDV